MKRICLGFLAISIFLLMVAPIFAQTPRQPTSSEGKSTFTNIAITGLDATGVPGYIEMVSTTGDRWYLYVDGAGVLRIASEPAVGFAASPQTTNWSRTSTRGEVGRVIGPRNLTY